MENQINSLAELAPLYDTFYIINEPRSVAAKETEKIEKTLIFSGKNTASVLFLFTPGTVLNDTDTEMLNNLIHKALNLNPEHVVWLYIEQNPDTPLTEIINYFPLTHIINWGNTDWSSVGVHESEPIASATMLHALPVSSYRDANDRKRDLWLGLQKQFQLN